MKSILAHLSNHKIILTLCIVLPILLSPIWHYEYHRDELLFLSYGNHIDFGYYSTPDFIGFLSFLVLHIPVDPYVSIRIIGMILAFLFLIYCVRIISLYNENKVLHIFAVFFIPLIIEKTVFMFHVTGFDIVLTTISIYYLLHYLQSKSQRSIILFFLFLAIGIINKYSILFYFVPLLLLLAYKKEIHIEKKSIKFIVVIFLVSVIPNLFWQIKHDFLFMKYVSHITHNQTNKTSYLDIFINILIISGNGVFFIIIGLKKILNTKTSLKIIGIAAISAVAIVVFSKGRGLYCYNFFPTLICFGILTFYLYFEKKTFIIYFYDFNIDLSDSSNIKHFFRFKAKSVIKLL